MVVRKRQKRQWCNREYILIAFYICLFLIHNKNNNLRKQITYILEQFYQLRWQKKKGTTVFPAHRQFATDNESTPAHIATKQNSFQSVAIERFRDWTNSTIFLVILFVVLVECTPESVHLRVPLSLIEVARDWQTHFSPSHESAEGPSFTWRREKFESSRSSLVARKGLMHIKGVVALGKLSRYYIGNISMISR